MADFNFYLNKSGIRGQKGEKGDTGFSPSIVEEVNTLTDYRLKIINEFDEFVTDNLRGSDYFDITDPNGTYLRFDKESGRAYTGALDQATNEAVGGARLASTSDMEAFSENTIVTPALFADSLVNLIVSPDGSLNITQNEQTSKTEITFNSTTLDTVRAELNRVKEDLATESQVRLNADNQQQVAIDAERRERETQDAALQAQISSITGDFVTVDTRQNITGQKDFDYITSKNLIVSNGSARLQLTGDNSTLSIKPVGASDDLVIGNANRFNGLTLAAGGGVKFEGDIPSIKKGNDYKKILSQDTVEQGDNIIVEQTTNGIKISSTGGGGKNEWGSITGNIEDQTDLKGQLDSIYDTIGDEVEAIDAMLDLKAEKATTYTKEEVNQIEADINAHIETVEGEIPTIATTNKTGIVQPDGTTITIDSDGKISAVGGSGSGDMTTNTDQNVTGAKTFIGKTLKISDGAATVNLAYYNNTPISTKDGYYTFSGYVQNGGLQVGNFYKMHFDDEGTSTRLYISKMLDLESVVAGENISLVKNESEGTLTISASGGGGTEDIQEALRLLNGGDSTLLDTKLDKSTPHVIDAFVDGTSGYRTWSDGYCEQWGNAHVSDPTDNFTVSFLKKFKDDNYIVTGTTVPPINYSGFTGTTSYRDISCVAFTISNKTVNSFKIQSIWTPDTSNGISGDKQWKACGYLAEGEY